MDNSGCCSTGRNKPQASKQSSTPAINGQSNNPAPWSANDIPPLPVELIATVASYLSPADIFSCVRTCKRWSSIFKRDLVIESNLKAVYPGLIEASRLEKSDSGTESWELFRQAWRKSRLRRKGRFQASCCQELIPREDLDTSTFFAPDPAGHATYGDGSVPMPEENEFIWIRRFPIPRYSHGRVAWECSDQHVVLDDLYKRQRKVISCRAFDAQRTYFPIREMTEKLLIVSSASPPADQNDLLVYHMEQQTAQKVQFPGFPSRMQAYGTNIGVTLRGDQPEGEDDPAQDPNSYKCLSIPYFWQWNDETPTRLNVEGLGLNPPSLSSGNVVQRIGFVFHPKDLSIFYLMVITVSRGSNTDGGSVVQLSAHKNQNGEFTNTFVHKIELDTVAVDFLRPFLQLHMEPQDSHGGHTISTIYPRPDAGFHFFTASFNVYTQSFAVSRMPGDQDLSLRDIWPNWPAGMLPTPFVWNGMVHFHLLAIESDIDISDAYIRFAATYGEKKRSEQPGYVHSAFIQSTWDARDHPPGTFGGDDGLLFIQDGAGYIIWSFDESLDMSGPEWTKWEDQFELMESIPSRMLEYT